MSNNPLNPRCSAKSKRSGAQCKRTAMAGATVCASHGGKAPQVKAAAERRRQERAAVLAVENFGLPREIDAHAALLEELHRTAGAVEWLGAVVADIDRDELAWGTTKETHGAHQDEGQQVRSEKRAGINVWVRLWQDERKHLVEVSRECIKSGIEERRVRLAESAGQQLASVVRAVLDRMLAALVEAIGAERAAELMLEALWAEFALRIAPEELRRAALGEDRGAA